ncbi:COX15/CtaA family protein [Dyadobacter psychrotolerans]|uniref:Heme A synthase n=1 Tax=Dyadobacter psychrotolerans TaxID=2541721 RepID=A0A4R5DK62_9BACT|nr:COX15/CtaA family protein [Dyadobacter psychrotolerans]TDE12361.1 heme A synthase [Dyadobacter psychrotolerans]
MTSSTPINIKASRRFRRLALNTVITLYCLIIAGGVVRSTGAGMGCPDWPKCFGRWIPPTKLSELPADYKTIYGAKLKGEIEFNPVKTWIEYGNRLIGAFTGVMIFLTLLASVPYLKSGSKKIFYYSLAAFLLVGIQGWLGSKVVSTELMPVMITLHMLLAIVIVFILLYLFTWSSFSQRILEFGINKRILNTLGWVVLTFSLLQILLGTQVRENIDEVIKIFGYEARASWIDKLDYRFYVHRSFSILILAVNLFWFYEVTNNGSDRLLVKLSKLCVAILVVELASGILMAYFGVPPYAQPVHLTLAILLIGLQFVVWLLVNKNKYLVKGQEVGGIGVDEILLK